METIDARTILVKPDDPHGISLSGCGSATSLVPGEGNKEFRLVRAPARACRALKTGQ